MSSITFLLGHSSSSSLLPDVCFGERDLNANLFMSEIQVMIKTVNLVCEYDPPENQNWHQQKHKWSGHIFGAIVVPYSSGLFGSLTTEIPKSQKYRRKHPKLENHRWLFMICNFHEVASSIFHIRLAKKNKLILVPTHGKILVSTQYFVYFLFLKKAVRNGWLALSPMFPFGCDTVPDVPIWLWHCPCSSSLVVTYMT